MILNNTPSLHPAQDMAVELLVTCGSLFRRFPDARDLSVVAVVTDVREAKETISILTNYLDGLDLTYHFTPGGLSLFIAGRIWVRFVLASTGETHDRLRGCHVDASVFAPGLVVPPALKQYLQFAERRTRAGRKSDHAFATA